MKRLRLALVQINPVVGDLAGNSKIILRGIQKARRLAADVAVFPELALTGYPPEDLVFKPQFISDNISEIKKIAGQVSGIMSIIGFIDRGPGKDIFNAAAIISDKKIVDVYHKMFLPNYGVFDEFRYFEPGGRYPVYRFRGVGIGINICEDIWHSQGPARVQAHAGAEVIININASPYERGKQERREEILEERSSDNAVVIAYLNTVGGQDELVFDGGSMVFDHTGSMIAGGKRFEEDLIVLDVDIDGVRRFRKSRHWPDTALSQKELSAVEKITIPGAPREGGRPITPVVSGSMPEAQEIYRALVLGTSDYILKNGFKGAVIGLSGGIDSSLVAAIAADAIGRENVHGVFMPSQFTSMESREDAYGLAENLGIHIMELPLHSTYKEYLNVLERPFSSTAPDTTEENLQARIRGNFLMALSNKFGWLVLTTGNKSEMSVGYATLYGDMAGGFAVIKDVPKTLVYKLSEWRNSGGHKVIPTRVLEKEPTAELRPGQKDTDTLPPYPALDPILEAYIEADLTFEEILKLGCDPEVVKNVIKMVDRSEYKRRQAPPGIKITARAFGRDRRFQITNQYRSY